MKYKGKKLDAYKNTWFRKKQQDQNKEPEVSDGKFLHPAIFFFCFFSVCACHILTEANWPIFMKPVIHTTLLEDTPTVYFLITFNH